MTRRRKGKPRGRPYTTEEARAAAGKRWHPDRRPESDEEMRLRDPSLPESDVRHWSPILRALPAFDAWLEADNEVPEPVDAMLAAYHEELMYWLDVGA